MSVVRCATRCSVRSRTKQCCFTSLHRRIVRTATAQTFVRCKHSESQNSLKTKTIQPSEADSSGSMTKGTGPNSGPPLSSPGVVQKFTFFTTLFWMRGRSPFKAFGGNHFSSAAVHPLAGAGSLRARRCLACGRPATAWPKSARTADHPLRKLPYQYKLDADPRPA
jgi:hypothetical protein